MIRGPAGSVHILVLRKEEKMLGSGFLGRASFIGRTYPVADLSARSTGLWAGWSLRENHGPSYAWSW